MAKPSIFSNNYDKKMRERKKRRKTILTLILIVLILGVAIFFGNEKFSNTISGLIKQNSTGDNIKLVEDDAAITDDVVSEDETKDETEDETKNIDQDTSIDEKENATELTEMLEFNLPSGDKVIATLDINNEIKTFNNIQRDNNQYTINPSKDKAVILDVKTQSIVLLQIDGSVTDITDESYKSSGGKVYTKEAIIESNPNYTWVTSPKFINDDKLAYVTQLPWFKSDGDLYLWEYSISKKNYINKNYKGKQIEFGNLTETGLETYIDGNMKILN
ncbi:hypothetical protein [Clostridium grantii]|uniref:Uncharacterized protein n=1 Tax=Clostridium grantii DSM 8605 TaxID=1121316 RepID=A0A1M5WBA4_9CLOT|nr:hypothetical protein [Clostridium grantii]SHH84730.1 hypothetical protein SAMN02745207_02788 [Clostridium grantii DSM 8605]